MPSAAEPVYVPSKRDTGRRRFGKWRIRYVAPDGKRYSITKPTKSEAAGAYAEEMRAIQLGSWLPPKVREANARRAELRGTLTLADYFEQFLARPGRTGSTQQTYRSAFDNGIAPRLGDLPIASISKADVGEWWAWLWKTFPKRATTNAQCYTLLATVFRDAVKSDLIEASPCSIPGAGRKPDPVHKRLLSVEELPGLIGELSGHYPLAVAVAAGCALRIGEWAELRPGDVIPEYDRGGVLVGVDLYITRQVKEQDGSKVVEPTKSKKNRRVPVPRSLWGALLGRVGEVEGNGLLFPNGEGGWVDRRRVNKMLKRAGRKVGRPDVSSHDFRHYGGTKFAQQGATLSETMERLGHSSTGAALRYQHATRERARALSDGIELPRLADVVDLGEVRERKGAG